MGYGASLREISYRNGGVEFLSGTDVSQKLKYWTHRDPTYRTVSGPRGGRRDNGGVGGRQTVGAWGWGTTVPRTPPPVNRSPGEIFLLRVPSTGHPESVPPQGSCWAVLFNPSTSSVKGYGMTPTRLTKRGRSSSNHSGNIMGWVPPKPDPGFRSVGSLRYEISQP